MHEPSTNAKKKGTFSLLLWGKIFLFGDGT